MIINYNDYYDKKIVLSLGFFDCVHIGHRKIFSEAEKQSVRYGAELSVMTFINNPFTFLNREDKLIYDFESRVRILENLGIRNIIECRFDENFIKISAEDFAEHLINHFNIGCIVCGSDYTYGYKGLGNALTLKEQFSEKGIEVIIVDLMKITGDKVSSSDIRRYIQEGKIETANNLLGEPYFIEGSVKKGRGVGRIIGFPTVNLEIDSERIIIKKGVYITKTIIGNREYVSISNVGSHPTFDDEHNNIETYIIENTENLYDKRIRIEFYSYIRDIVKFDSGDRLGEQLKADTIAAKSYFEERK